MRQSSSKKLIARSFAVLFSKSLPRCVLPRQQRETAFAFNFMSESRRRLPPRIFSNRCIFHRRAVCAHNFQATPLLHPPAGAFSHPRCTQSSTVRFADGRSLSSLLEPLARVSCEGLRESWLISTIFKKHQGREQKAFRPSFTGIAFSAI